MRLSVMGLTLGPVWRRAAHRAVGLVALAVAASVGCGAPAGPRDPSPARDDGDPQTPAGNFNGGRADEDGGGGSLTVGGQARTTSVLNLRDGIGTSAAVIEALPCGALLAVLAGPSTAPTAGWWQVTSGGTMGWSSGRYLVPDTAFSPSLCGPSGSTGDGGVPDGSPVGSDGGSAAPTSVAEIFQRAQAGVGYSYFWGHGSWLGDGTQLGSCSGSCPSCTHSGSYGADCSGFVAKAWQVPQASPLGVDEHPYSTYDFYNQQLAWTQVPRSSLQPADALVRNANGSGHMLLFESGPDPWGNIWTYEARGCATGVVHNLRVADTTFIAIRRSGL